VGVMLRLLRRQDWLQPPEMVPRPQEGEFRCDLMFHLNYKSKQAIHVAKRK
jgi:hypothetical protein